MRLPSVPIRVGVLIAAVPVVLTATAGTAGAHAELLESEPAAGEKVTEGVDSVQLTLLAFDPDEPVTVEVPAAVFLRPGGRTERAR